MVSTQGREIPPHQFAPVRRPVSPPSGSCFAKEEPTGGVTISPCCPSTHCPGRAANASPALDHQGPHAGRSGSRRRGGASARRPPDAGTRPGRPVPAPTAARPGPARGGGASRPVPAGARWPSCTVGGVARAAAVQWAWGGGAPRARRCASVCPLGRCWPPQGCGCGGGEGDTELRRNRD